MRFMAVIDLVILGFACVSLIVTLTTKPEKQEKEPIKKEQNETPT